MSPREEWALTRDSCFYFMLVRAGMHMRREYLPYFVIVQCMEHTREVGSTSVDDCV
jgi:ribosomal protein S4E